MHLPAYATIDGALIDDRVAARIGAKFLPKATVVTTTVDSSRPLSSLVAYALQRHASACGRRTYDTGNAAAGGVLLVARAGVIHTLGTSVPTDSNLWLATSDGGNCSAPTEQAGAWGVVASARARALAY